MEFGRFLPGLYKEYEVEFIQKGYTSSKRIKEEDMKKLIVLSADALVEEDMEYLETLPNFKKYLAGGVGVRKVHSVYPTITYPCHTTMITGVYPDSHKVTGNLELHPGRTSDLPWKWDYKYNACKQDIFTEAKKAGYETAAVFWPVTGNHPAIDHLIDEYWIQSEEDTPEAAFRRMGSDEQMLRIVEKNSHGVKRPLHPQLDTFIVDCACDVIRECQPDILFLHPADVDWARHQYGVFNDQVKKAVESTDHYIGQIMKAVEDIGAAENTNLVLVSDHGQRNITKIVNINAALKEHGLIRVDENGEFRDWDAWCLSGGMSAEVHLRHPENLELYGRVKQLLETMQKDSRYGIERIFTKEEAGKEHLDGTFSFILEALDGVSFGDEFHSPLVAPFETKDYRYGHATHGYLPEKGPQPVFYAKGPDFREHVVLEHARLVDEAPTFAELLGLEFPNVQGSCLWQLLKKDHSGRKKQL